MPSSRDSAATKTQADRRIAKLGAEPILGKEGQVGVARLLERITRRMELALEISSSHTVCQGRNHVGFSRTAKESVKYRHT